MGGAKTYHICINSFLWHLIKYKVKCVILSNSDRVVGGGRIPAAMHNFTVIQSNAHRFCICCDLDAN